MNKDYKKYARILKKNKLIDIDLRKNLTSNQKRQISALYNHWGAILDSDKLVQRTVSTKRVNQLKKQGYKAIGNKVFIPTERYPSKGIRVTEKGIRYKSDDKELFVVASGNILEQLESMTDKQMPEGTYITVRIGSHSRFGHAFDNIGKLLDYIKQWKPTTKDGRRFKKEKHELISQMQIVTFNDAEWEKPRPIDSHKPKRGKAKYRSKHPRGI